MWREEKGEREGKASCACFLLSNAQQRQPGTHRLAKHNRKSVKLAKQAILEVSAAVLLHKVREGTWNPDSLENFTTTIGFEKKREMVEDEWKQGISHTAPFEVEEGDTSRTEGEKEVTQELLSPTQMWGPGEEEEEVSQESSDEEGDGEENSESDSELEEHVLETAAIIQQSDTTLDMRRFLNVKSGKTHAGKPGSGSLAKCGKTLESLQRLATGPDEGEEDVDYCKKCFRSVP